MTVEDEMAMHETQRWELQQKMLKQLVEEMISSAYENGYEAEIKDLSDEELAHDIFWHLDQVDEVEVSGMDILAAVKEFRK